MRWFPAVALLSLNLHAKVGEIAVLRTIFPDSLSQPGRTSLSIVFRSSVQTTKRWTLVEMERIDEVAKEHALSASGCLDTACVLDAAKLLHAQRVIELEVVGQGDGIYGGRIRNRPLTRSDSVKETSIDGVDFGELVYFIHNNIVLRPYSLVYQVESTPWSRRSGGMQFRLSRGILGDGTIRGDGYGFNAGLRIEHGIARASLNGGFHKARLRHSVSLDGVVVHPDTTGDTDDFELQCGVDIWPGASWDVTPFVLAGMSQTTFRSTRPTGQANETETLFEKELPWDERIGFGIELSRKYWYGGFVEFSSLLSWQYSWAVAGANGPEQEHARQRLLLGLAVGFGKP